MKATEKTDFGFKNELEFHHNYFFLGNDLRIKQLENHDFVVPWQMVVTEEKEVLVE